MVVHFYDVGQGLAALVDLPDGRHILVDTGDPPKRARACATCQAEDAPRLPLLIKLAADLRGAPIDMLWITHPHSDHIGGAPSVLRAFAVARYVDNGRDESKPEVVRARREAQARGVPLHVVSPDHPALPMGGSPDVKLAAVVPPAWPPACAHDPNECSIGLRVDFCSSSVLLTGDAEHAEEAQLDAGRVTLLQVAHHGSETSTTPGFLSKARPTYAVISAGRPGEGANREYCHPRAIVVQRLTRLLGGPGSRALDAFDGLRCDDGTSPASQGRGRNLDGTSPASPGRGRNLSAVDGEWISVPASDRLWATERDGDVVLSTRGDGAFERK